MNEVYYPVTAESKDAAFNIWNYLKVSDPLEEVYAILAMGCTRGEIAVKAAEAYHHQITTLIISTGGNSKKTENWSLSEAVYYDQILDDHGVPKKSRLIEKESKNFGQNLKFTKDLLESKGCFPDKILGVTIDYGSRRWKASCQKQWPGVKARVIPSGIDFESYLDNTGRFNILISQLRSEFGKILTYPKEGFMIEQDLNDPKFIRAFNADGELIEMRSKKLVAV